MDRRKFLHGAISGVACTCCFGFASATPRNAHAARSHEATLQAVAQGRYNLCGTRRVDNEIFQGSTRRIQRRLESVAGVTRRIDVPVYFHIMHDGGPSNIPDKMLSDQLAIMNVAYNPYHIYFTHGGSLRYDNPALFGQDGEEYIGTIANAYNVDPTKYLNFYISQLGDPADPDVLFGIGAFPWMANRPNWNENAIAVHYMAMPEGDFGKIEDLGPQTGATGVHEAGHWLGFYHTFQEDCSILEGDEVFDTPAHGSDTTMLGCGAGHQPPKSCDGSAAIPNLNVMNYNFDPCMTEVTLGQADRIFAAMSAYRPTFVSAGPPPATSQSEPPPAPAQPPVPERPGGNTGKVIILN